MTFNELVTLLKKQNRRADCQFLDKAPMVHEGYPGTFNLSFTNYEFRTNFNSYISFPTDFIFSKVGQMIRIEDWRDYYQNGEPDNTHLVLFHMGDIGGINLISKGSYELSIKLAKENIANIKSFMVDQLGLDIAKFKISYFPGGKINEATKNKYQSEDIIPPDPTIELWYEYGFTKNNLFAEFNRNTLLSLHNSNMISPWGYRNEIHYEYNNELWDIATIENFFFRPHYDENGTFQKITSWEHSFGVAAIGLERVLTIVNNVDSVHHLDEIKQLDYVIMESINELPKNKIIKLRESLRVLCAIFAEVTYIELSGKRKQKVRWICKLISDILFDFKINKEVFQALLIKFCDTNAEIRKSYTELTENKEQIITEIMRKLDTIRN